MCGSNRIKIIIIIIIIIRLGNALDSYFYYEIGLIYKQ